MKKIILFAAFLVLFAIPAIAQKPIPPPDMAPDYEPKLWKEYSFADDNVRFRFPVEPTRKDDTFSGDPGHVYARMSFMQYYLSVITGPADLDLEGPGKAVLNASRDGMLKQVKDQNPKLTKDEDISVDGHPGELFQFETSDGLVHRAKVFVVKNRMYIAIMIVKKGEQHGTNWQNDFEVPTMAFLDSVRLINK